MTKRKYLKFFVKFRKNRYVNMPGISTFRRIISCYVLEFPSASRHPNTLYYSYQSKYVNIPPYQNS